MSGEPTPADEDLDGPALPDGDALLTTLIEQMHRNWDQGDNAANDVLMVRIREHIRSQRETAMTGSPRCQDHSESTDTPTSASNRRVSGRLMPMTLDGSPSMPSTNQPPSPSKVNPPATASGSPVPT